MKRHAYSKEWPGFLRDETAARYFDMTVKEFLGAVAVGELPLPVTINGLERWKKSDLENAATPARPKKPWLPS